MYIFIYTYIYGGFAFVGAVGISTKPTTEQIVRIGFALPQIGRIQLHWGTSRIHQTLHRFPTEGLPIPEKKSPAAKV